MTEVHHIPKSYFNPMYSYPYCAGMNSPVYYPSYMSRNHQNNYPLNQSAFIHSYPVAVDNAPRFESLDERVVKDHGARPYVVNIDKVTKQNNTYRTAIWTGKHFQVTVMSINVRDDIGLEVHPHTDQFIRIEEGQGLVQMGDTKDRLNFQEKAYDGYAIMIPAGKWHNVINTGNKPLKIYVIYAPPHHPYGTVQQTKAMAMTPHSRPT
ncbi:cupin domain-containing protein [Paenibacillus tyrfis]|uniref:cupin domain-containing protein n=1 Tax=Paenibacillus tyrfis TaxID=1501230 RepID=UPI002646C656